MNQELIKTEGSKPVAVNKVKTKQRLIDAGLKLFAEYGFEGVSVSDLETAVGLKSGSGSFYRHFANKLELLKAIVEAEIEEASQRRILELEAFDNESKDLRESLRQHFRLTLNGLNENSSALLLLMREQNHFPDLLQHLQNEVIYKAQLTVISHYSKKVASGEMIQLDPVKLTSVIQSALFGISQVKKVLGEPIDKEFEDGFIETLVELVINKG